MGLSPRAVDDCSLWQLAAAADGYARAHGGEDRPALTDDEFEAAARWIA